ncbi:MAG TPA: type VI secretion system contractile sheath small subunit [Herpetosiphonaceae bacterium]
MPVIESTQHVLDRVRPPRVQITYDVEIGNAIEKVELPFVLGILADLSGSTENPLPLKDRKFVEIDRDNFNQILRAIGPTLENLVVEEVLPHTDGERLSVSLRFTQMADFQPANLVTQVPALKALLEERKRLRDLQAKLDGNDTLSQALLEDVTRALPGA